MTMTNRRTRRTLTREERELWSHVTRNDLPLAKHRRSKPASNGADLLAPQGEAVPSERQPSSPPKPANAAPVKPAPTFPVRRGPEPFDHRLSRKIARGRQPIDARLDLHGMRQEEAYAALKHFLARACAEGRRHVLIITGKGGRGAGEHAIRDFWRGEQRGILRRLVPQWLGEVELRPYVVAYTAAAPHHGGDGALYVTVRTKAKMSRP